MNDFLHKVPLLLKNTFGKEAKSEMSRLLHECSME